MQSLLQILKEVWRARVHSFLPIYVFMTGVAAIAVACVVGCRSVPIPELSKEPAVSQTQAWRPVTSLAATILVGSILAGYLAIALKWEAFADYDDSYFTLYTLRGRPFGPMIVQSTGRFFPLHLQEFNFIRHFTSSVAGYHAVPIAQLLVVSCILLFLNNALSAKARVAITAVYLILSSTVYTFTGLIFPERNVIFWLACMLLFVTLFDRSRFTAWAVAAAISAQIMLYYKETAFLLLLGFAAGRLMLRCRGTNGKDWDLGQFRNRRSRLDLCLISLAMIFLLYYVSVMFRHPNMQYASESAVSWRSAVLYYLRLDLLALLLLVVLVRRAYLIFRRGLTPMPLWDGLALGGVAYYAAYICLRMVRPYYLAPVDFIALLYVGRLLAVSWDKMRPWSRMAASVVALAVLAQNLSFSAFHVYERENMIHAKVILADVIAARSEANANHAGRLFFPFSDTYPLTEFASYLVYRGVLVEGEDAALGSEVPYGDVIVSPAFTKDSSCVDYRRFVCHAAKSPRSGDLVIELPDDLESMAQIEPYRMGGSQLITYNPRPGIPQSIYPSLNYLRVVSYRWRFVNLPDRWLQASITEWK